MSFFEYLNIILLDKRIITLLLKKLHYLVFKEQNLREIISQNQVEKLFYIALLKPFST